MRYFVLYIILFACSFAFTQNDKAVSLSITVESSVPDSVLLPNLEELTIFTKSKDFQIDKNLLELQKLKSLSILVENDEYSLPDWIGEFKSLEELYIKWSLKNVPKALFEIKGLKALSLIGTFDEIPKDIENLYQIEYLNISSSNITVLPKEVFKLGTLGFLSIANCSLNELPLEVQDLDKMEYLDLGNNMIHTLPNLSNCESLIEVNLHENRITPYEMSLIQKLNSNLVFKYDYRFQKFNHIRTYKEIRPNDGNISKSVKAALKNKKIQILDLSHCQDIDKELSLLSKKVDKLQHIEVLKLNGNQLHDIPESLDGLKNVKEIYLQGNQLSVMPVCIHSMENLRIINVSDNPFSGFGTQDLQLHQLKKLIVNEDVMNTAIIKKFYEFIPNLRVIMK